MSYTEAIPKRGVTNCDLVTNITSPVEDSSLDPRQDCNAILGAMVPSLTGTSDKERITKGLRYPPNFSQEDSEEQRAKFIAMYKDTEQGVKRHMVDKVKVLMDNATLFKANTKYRSQVKSQKPSDKILQEKTLDDVNSKQEALFAVMEIFAHPPPGKESYDDVLDAFKNLITTNEISNGLLNSVKGICSTFKVWGNSIEEFNANIDSPKCRHVKVDINDVFPYIQSFAKWMSVLRYRDALGGKIQKCLVQPARKAVKDRRVNHAPILLKDHVVKVLEKSGIARFTGPPVIDRNYFVKMVTMYINTHNLLLNSGSENETGIKKRIHVDQGLATMLSISPSEVAAQKPNGRDKFDFSTIQKFYVNAYYKSCPEKIPVLDDNGNQVINSKGRVEKYVPDDLLAKKAIIVNAIQSSDPSDPNCNLVNNFHFLVDPNTYKPSSPINPRR